MILNKLKNEFNEIEKVFFEKEGSNTFLRVEVILKDLAAITLLSKEISHFLDKHEAEIEAENYFLDVYSSGTDKELKIEELKDYLNENILVELKDKIKNKDYFIGNLINIKPIIIKWNDKGQFRKQEIEIDKIAKISLYAQFKAK